MHRTTVRAIALLAFLGGPLPSSPAFAQATPTEPAPSSSSPGTPPAAAAPTPAPPVASAPAAPMLPAKGLDGMDVFSSDGQQVGKVVKVNVIAEGKVKDVEVHSSGFFGFFSSAYVLPADKLTIKGGRLDVAMTSEQVKQSQK
jgi:sporulation protein YlmC with PRC-barrel domain